MENSFTNSPPDISPLCISAIEWPLLYDLTKVSLQMSNRQSDQFLKCLLLTTNRKFLGVWISKVGHKLLMTITNGTGHGFYGASTQIQALSKTWILMGYYCQSLTVIATISYWKMPSLQWTCCYHFHDKIVCHNNSLTCQQQPLFLILILILILSSHFNNTTVFWCHYWSLKLKKSSTNRLLVNDQIKTLVWRVLRNV